MSDYIVKYHDTGKIVNVSLDQLNNPESSKSRWALYKKQSNHEITLYCGCTAKSPIEMTITTHTTPHIQTKHRDKDGGRHFEYCRHHRNNQSEHPYIYKCALQYDPDTQKEFCNVQLLGSKQKQQEVKAPEQYNEPKFFCGNQNIVYEKQMDLSAFIKYMNISYFETYQRRADGKPINVYLNSLWAKINHTLVGANIKTAVKVKDLLEQNGCEYFQQYIYGTEKYQKKDGTISTKQHYIITSADKKQKMLVNTAAITRAIQTFRKTYGFGEEFPIESKKEYKFLLCGIRSTDPREVYNPEPSYVVILTNELGLYSESIAEARCYNALCDTIIKNPAVKERYVLRKPYFPENIYRGYPNYIADAVIESKTIQHKIAFECFGFNNNFNGYLDRKRNKIASCAIDHVFYDPTQPPIAPNIYSTIEECMTALRALLK